MHSEGEEVGEKRKRAWTIATQLRRRGRRDDERAWTIAAQLRRRGRREDEYAWTIAAQ